MKLTKAERRDKKRHNKLTAEKRKNVGKTRLKRK